MEPKRYRITSYTLSTNSKCVPIDFFRMNCNFITLSYFWFVQKPQSVIASKLSHVLVKITAMEC